MIITFPRNVMFACQSLNRNYLRISFVCSKSICRCDSNLARMSDMQLDGTYPLPPSCNQQYVPIGTLSGYAVNSSMPLTTELCYLQRKIEAPSPSYREVREQLSGKLDQLSRKEKRKLIKNKRNRIRRIIATQRINNAEIKVRFTSISHEG